MSDHLQDRMGGGIKVFFGAVLLMGLVWLVGFLVKHCTWFDFSQ